MEIYTWTNKHIWAEKKKAVPYLQNDMQKDGKNKRKFGPSGEKLY